MKPQGQVGRPVTQERPVKIDVVMDIGVEFDLLLAENIVLQLCRIPELCRKSADVARNIDCIEGGYFWPHFERIGAYCRLSDSHVRLLMRQLTNKGLVEKHPHWKSVYKYTKKAEELFVKYDKPTTKNLWWDQDIW